MSLPGSPEHMDGEECSEPAQPRTGHHSKLGPASRSPHYDSTSGAVRVLVQEISARLAFKHTFKLKEREDRVLINLFGFLNWREF